MSVLIDSWGWLGLFDVRDQDHMKAKEAILGALHGGAELITTDYVLGETITLLFRRVDRNRGAEVLRDLLGFIEDANVVVERISGLRFAEAVDLRFRYDDKPRISFTDLTSIVVMEELGIRDIITRDRDFLAVNLGFRLVPGT